MQQKLLDFITKSILQKTSEIVDGVVKENVPTLTAYLLCFGAAILLGLLIAFAFTFRANKKNGSFAFALALLPFAVGAVIMIVNNQIGMAVAVAGAFSLVRFRSAPGSAKEIAAVFVAMAVGLACGAGLVGLAVIFAVVSSILAVVYTLVRLGETRRETKELKVLIPENLDYTDIFEDIFAEFTAEATLVHVKTSNMGSLYKLTYDVVMKPGASEKKMLDEIRCRNGNLDVSFGRHAEEAEAL